MRPYFGRGRSTGSKHKEGMAQAVAYPIETSTHKWEWQSYRNEPT